MRIAGIDPGTNITGWSVFENGGLLDYGRWKFPDSIETDEDLLVKLQDGYSKMSEFLGSWRIDFVIIESQFIGRKVKDTNSVIKLCYFVGVLLTAIIHKGLRFEFVTPTEVKEAVTGYGRAKKHQVREIINMSFGLNLRRKDEDISDAIAIGWMFSEEEAT